VATVLVFWLAVFVMSMLVVFLFCTVAHDVQGIAESGGVFGAFVGGVGFEFSAIRGTVLFDFLGFLLGELSFGGGLVFGGVQVSFFLTLFLFGFFFREFGFSGGVNFFDLFFFVEFGSADQSVGLRVIGSFLVFRFGKFEGEGCSLLVV
jgi:hypothetical protein